MLVLGLAAANALQSSGNSRFLLHLLEHLEDLTHTQSDVTNKLAQIALQILQKHVYRYAALSTEKVSGIIHQAGISHLEEA